MHAYESVGWPSFPLLYPGGISYQKYPTSHEDKYEESNLEGDIEIFFP